MKKKLMILGASILQLPAIREAKNMGLEVIAVDMDKNAIGFKDADICLNISTIAVSQIAEEAKKYRIDGIMTLASDMPMISVASVAKQLGIVGISEETALNTTNKIHMRECLKAHGVPVPKFAKVIEYDEYKNVIGECGSNCVVKPADSSGSRGVYLVRDITDKNDIDYAYKYSKKYSRNGQIIVEEYMEGLEISVEAISFKGEVHIIAITDKLTTGAPRFVEMGHSQPSQFDSQMQNLIRNVATLAIKAVGIDNGPSHTEIIITSDGPKIVEIGARLGGDNITTHLVPLSTGVNIVKSSIDIALGNIPELDIKHNKGSAIRYFNSQNGKLMNIEGIEEVCKYKGVKQVFFAKNVGEYINDVNNSSDRIGFVISQGDDAEDAVNICKNVIDRLKIYIK